MIKTKATVALFSALLLSAGAYAQNMNSDNTAPNMQKTPDGVTDTPDAAGVPPTKSSGNSSTTHSKHSKKKTHRKHHAASSSGSSYGTTNGGTSEDQAPNMRKTPDGVTDTPDAAVPSGR